jgi:hypothetical protein
VVQLVDVRGRTYIFAMARKPEDLSRLARELAALTPEERAQVLAEVERHRQKFRPLPQDFTPPVLEGGTEWVGGSLSREELYGDDGR